MYSIMEFIFNNIIWIILILIIFYFVKEYKYLKDRISNMNKQFHDTLDAYLIRKVQEAKQIVEMLLIEYNEEDTIKTELARLLIIMEKGETGSINEKVETSNALNKYKLSKQLDIDKYPKLRELDYIGTFTEEDINSLDNGVKLARTTYNKEAILYNEKASSFLMQYLTKIVNLNTNYVIFDQTSNLTQNQSIEILQDKEEITDTLSNLNLQEVLPERKEEVEESLKRDYTNNVIKPSISIDRVEDKE